MVETATFGAFAVPLAEYGIAERADELNEATARIAREVADGHDGLVAAGRSGPGTKFASLGQIRFAELRDAYEVQARGLLEGGVDLLLVETQFDLLGAKAAIIGCRRAMAATAATSPSRCRSPWSSPARCCSAPRSVPPWPPSTPCAPTSSASTAPPGPRR